MTLEEIERLRNAERVWAEGPKDTPSLAAWSNAANAICNAAPALLDAAERSLKLELVREAAAKLMLCRTLQSYDWINNAITAEEELKAALAALEGGA